MFCISCGKDNPDGALYCAFCGVQLLTGEQETEDERFKRPDPSRLVVPLEENPVQPVRRTEARRRRRAEPPPPPRKEPREEPWEESWEDLWEEPREPRRSIPERRAPVIPRKRADRENPNTIVPRKRRVRKEDPFFEMDEYDEVESAYGRHVKSAVAGLFLLAVLAGIFYLLVMPGGQKLRASMGLGGKAWAHAALGDEYLEGGSVKRAADAYYDALRMDPDNFDYALKVARTQEMIGDRDKALNAYAKCIDLDPTRPEPYTEVAELYRLMGDVERQKNSLKAGFDRTGDTELFRAYEKLIREETTPEPTPEPTPTPTPTPKPVWMPEKTSG